MKFTQKEIDTFDEIIDDEYEAYLKSYMLDASLEDFDDFINYLLFMAFTLIFK
jgi:hypothetical protein